MNRITVVLFWIELSICFGLCLGKLAWVIYRGGFQ